MEVCGLLSLKITVIFTLRQRGIGKAMTKNFNVKMLCFRQA